jgi:hypothetical protein
MTFGIGLMIGSIIGLVFVIVYDAIRARGQG